MLNHLLAVARPHPPFAAFAITQFALLCASVCFTLQVGFAGLARAQAIGVGAFELVDHNARPFSSAAVTGQPYAVFFGFTHCPDVCPTTLLEMSNNLRRLGADGDRLKIIFISVDPQRDTPAQLREYLSAFDSRIIGLTGTEEQVAAAAKGWNAFHHKQPESDGSYTIVHSAHVYLMDRRNRLAGTLNFQQPEDEQVEKLRQLIAAK